ncbi:hypothetical protein ACNOYE_18445 [Nannocystaceae bacterium ST9]
MGSELAPRRRRRRGVGGREPARRDRARADPEAYLHLAGIDRQSQRVARRRPRRRNARSLPDPPFPERERMVLPPPTAPEGQAAEAEWLRELRRWLHLGHKGVIIAIRAAQPARIREFATLMESIDPSHAFECEAERLLDVPVGGLVALAIRERDLDWMNINRPIFSQRSLRAVFWVEANLAAPLRFRSPDLHDWISHFVACPPGAPGFAVERLRAGLTARKQTMVWQGGFVGEALSASGFEPRGVVDELSTWADGEGRTMVLREGVNSIERLEDWQPAADVTTILVNPGLRLPHFFTIDARQMPLEDAAKALRAAGAREPTKIAALAELQPALIDAIAYLQPSPEQGRDLLAAAKAALEPREGELESRTPLNLEDVVTRIFELIDRRSSEPELDAYLRMILVDAKLDFGDGVLGSMYRRVVGLAHAIAGQLEAATEHLSAVRAEAVRTGASKLAGVGSELAAVLYLRGRYTEALNAFDDPTEGPENHIVAATVMAAGGATATADIHGSPDDVIAFLRARLGQVAKRT